LLLASGDTPTRPACPLPEYAAWPATQPAQGLSSHSRSRQLSGMMPSSRAYRSCPGGVCPAAARGDTGKASVSSPSGSYHICQNEFDRYALPREERDVCHTDTGTTLHPVPRPCGVSPARSRAVVLISASQTSVPNTQALHYHAMPSLAVLCPTWPRECLVRQRQLSPCDDHRIQVNCRSVDQMPSAENGPCQSPVRSQFPRTGPHPSGLTPTVPWQ
jgi:hypothetical protein